MDSLAQNATSHLVVNYEICLSRKILLSIVMYTIYLEYSEVSSNT